MNLTNIVSGHRSCHPKYDRLEDICQEQLGEGWTLMDRTHVLPDGEDYREMEHVDCYRVMPNISTYDDAKAACAAFHVNVSEFHVVGEILDVTALINDTAGATETFFNLQNGDSSADFPFPFC